MRCSLVGVKASVVVSSVHIQLLKIVIFIQVLSRNTRLEVSPCCLDDDRPPHPHWCQWPTMPHAHIDEPPHWQPQPLQQWWVTSPRLLTTMTPINSNNSNSNSNNNNSSSNNYNYNTLTSKLFLKIIEPWLCQEDPENTDIAKGITNTNNTLTSKLFLKIIEPWSCQEDPENTEIAKSIA